jgi:hypothetical protein
MSEVQKAADLAAFAFAGRVSNAYFSVIDEMTAELERRRMAN